MVVQHTRLYWRLHVWFLRTRPVVAIAWWYLYRLPQAWRWIEKYVQADPHFAWGMFKSTLSTTVGSAAWVYGRWPRVFATPWERKRRDQ